MQFALNGNPENPHCAGVRGVLDAYAQAIQRVTLWGPTNFAPVIRHTIDIARTGGQEQKYLVLLIITDGAITDMHATKVCGAALMARLEPGCPLTLPDLQAAISEAANLPISIIIVGVGVCGIAFQHSNMGFDGYHAMAVCQPGGADFTSMEELDGDDVRLTSSCSRDIVQVYIPRGGNPMGETPNCCASRTAVCAVPRLSAPAPGTPGRRSTGGSS